MDEQASFWNAGSNGLLVAEVHGFRLIVRPPGQVGGLAEFMVLQPHPYTRERLFKLVASGNGSDVHEAMRAAEWAAASSSPAA